ncbi:MAG: hypothetical protein HOP07_02295 [Bacteriovoracaceae bacterium]|nr:hypothetical protein [Bacteriovoracaceae bacterium]
MKTILAISLLAFSLSSMASTLSPSCKNDVLRALRTRTIETSGQALDFEKMAGGNLAPVVGSVCKNKKAFVVKLINNNTAEVTAIVNPWAGEGNKQLVTCDDAPLEKYPVNIVSVRLSDCKLTLTKIYFEFDLND